MKNQMKRICLLFFILTIGLSNCLNAQGTQISGSDFETWYENHYNTMFPNQFYWEMEPTHIWASGNEASQIAGVFPTSRTEDAYSGIYAARLETKEIFSQIASGSLFTGSFIADMFDSQALLGIPFTDKPSHFSGWYKYTPGTYKNSRNVLSTDECSIYALLSKWNGTSRDTIALAKLQSSQTVSEYTNFNLEFVYESDETPDSISVVFASSALGDLFIGGVGSVLYIDEIELIYDQSSITNTNNLSDRITYQLNDKHLEIRTSCTESSLKIYNIFGRLLYNNSSADLQYNINLNSFNPGVYIIYLTDNKGNAYTEKVLLK
jgi:hypothetical protein